MQEQIDNLTRQVNELQKQVSAFNDYSKIPLEVENAFINRGFAKGGDLSTYNYTTVTVGAGGGSFAVPVQPTGTVALTISGKKYYLLYR